MESSLTIYKASAGSGKTFTLAVRYIALVADNPETYKHILAVTFTNKATAEMKERIIQHLYGIANSLPESDGYLDNIQQLLPRKSQDEIRRNAGIALNNILHDYSNLHIETIDSFFQRILRGMAKELQIGYGMQLELDTKSVIESAVDSFIENLEPGSPELNWIIEFVNNSIDDGNNLRLSENLSIFSNKIFQEEFQEKGQELRDYLQNKDKLKCFLGELNDIIKECRQNITDAATRVIDVLSAQNLTPEEMTRGLSTLIRNCQNADIEQIDTTRPNIVKAFQDPQGLFSKQLQKVRKDINLDIIHSEFCNLVNEADSITADYNTAILSKQFLYELNLLTSIRKQIDNDNIRLNRFIMADTCALLNKMHQGDTSFIFEKTGSTISHIMIDESQDTSTLQWRNLNIILLETLAQNRQSLVVGDVKQAIYRWRNGNWQYLNSKLKNEVFAGFAPQEKTLSTNFRSLENIVEFNNKIFDKIIKCAQQYHLDNIGAEHEDLKLAYSDVHQEHHDNSGKGYADVRIFIKNDTNKEEFSELYDTAIADTIYEYIENGVNVNDIAILLRTGTDIKQISQLLENDERFKGISIISAEAFELGASAAVNILIFALRCLHDASDLIAQAALKLLVPDCGKLTDFEEQKSSLSVMSIYQAAQTICTIFNLEQIEGESAYLNSFFDNLGEYLKGGSSTLKEFLDFWDVHMQKVNVPASADNGISLMTVHKSKGLEFHTVIIPYANWKLTDYSSHEKQKHIWCHSDKEPYSEIPLIPVDFSTKCKDSYYSDFFKAEFGMQLVDNLNILYVALTRAKCNLTILGEYKISKTQEKKDSTIADLIVNSLEVEPEDNCYRFSTGAIEPSHSTKEETGKNPFKHSVESLSIQSHYYSNLPDFKESVAASKFNETIDMEQSDKEQEKQERYIQTGQLLHQLFSEIRTNNPQQIEQAIDNLVHQGLIDAGKEKEQIRHFVTKAFENKTVAEWFSGNCRLINEGTILFKKNNTDLNRRPDRIMLYSDHTVVVDFKFGKERAEYMYQVKEYMSLLKEMNMPNVQGYIWYVYSGRIDRVSL